MAEAIKYAFVCCGDEPLAYLDDDRDVGGDVN
jgi:hypothetical protein